MDLNLVFSGVKSNLGGNLCIAIYDRADTFLTNKHYFGACQPVTDLSWIVKVRKNQQLAFSALHDKDQNGELTTRIFGIPAEGIGFSNNPSIFTGPPDFSEVVLFVDQKTTVAIELKYLF